MKVNIGLQVLELPHEADMAQTFLHPLHDSIKQNRWVVQVSWKRTLVITYLIALQQSSKQKAQFSASGGPISSVHWQTLLKQFSSR